VRHDATLDAVPSYLVEAYLEDAPGALAGARAQARLAARSGDGVRYVRSTFLPVDELVLHLFEAASDGLVRRAASRADLRYQRIVEAVEGSLSREGSP
jgi:hypothetical protein